jgi:hypothetical protein
MAVLKSSTTTTRNIGYPSSVERKSVVINEQCQGLTSEQVGIYINTDSLQEYINRTCLHRGGTR